MLPTAVRRGWDLGWFGRASADDDDGGEPALGTEGAAVGSPGPGVGVHSGPFDVDELEQLER